MSDTQEQITEALNGAFRASGELIVTHYVLVAQTIDGDGERGTWAVAPVGQQSWETLGLLEYASRRETSGGEL